MTKKRRDSFLFRGHWFDAISALPEEYQLEAYQAIAYYALTGREIERMCLTTRGILLMAQEFLAPPVKEWRKTAMTNSGKKRGGNPNFKKGHPNPYRKKIDKTLKEKKIAHDDD